VNPAHVIAVRTEHFDARLEAVQGILVPGPFRSENRPA
jgi:hypothetical protein